MSSAFRGTLAPTTGGRAQRQKFGRCCPSGPTWAAGYATCGKGGHSAVCVGPLLIKKGCIVDQELIPLIGLTIKNIVVYIISGIPFAVFTAYLASNKQRDGLLWFILGWIFQLPALLALVGITFLVPPSTTQSQSTAGPPISRPSSSRPRTKYSPVNAFINPALRPKKERKGK